MSLTKREMESRPGWGELSEEEAASLDDEAAYQAAHPEQFDDDEDGELFGFAEDGDTGGRDHIPDDDRPF